MNVTLPNPFTVVITGLATSGLPLAQWEAVLNNAGELLQAKIADTFSAQRTAAGPLRRNDPKYTADKIKHGLDPRRGHRTNTLQSLLRPGASKLFTVRGPFKNGRAEIKFRENLLHSMVPYAEYYEAAKVLGAGILQIARTWLVLIRPMLQQANALAERVTKAESAVALRRGAVFAARPTFIRPALGLTRAVSTDISKSLTQGLTKSQLRRIARLAGR